jgi:UDP-N-acetylmuramoyl-tripeptide--D-alanyl-D-alanine ligase
MYFIKKIVVFILLLESRLILAKYKPFIIAVTGSVGKTSTKDAIYTALKSSSVYVRKSEKSMNSEIGLPLTIIGAPNAWRSLSGWLQNIWKGLILIMKRTSYPDCLVLEIGADHPNDIRSVAKWLRPNIAVITKIANTPVHVEFFASAEQVFQEKASLAVNVRQGGTVILYADDEKVLSIAKMVENKNVKIMTFGLSQNAEVRGSNGHIVYENNFPTGYAFEIELDGKKYEILNKKVLGGTLIYPNLCAIAVAKVRGVNIENAVSLLQSHESPKGRMNVLSGLNDSVIIDDTYNSSPDAVVSALETLKSIQTGGRKIAILGDMMELGKYSADQHREIGKKVAEVANILVTVGSRSYATADEAIKSGMKAENVMSFDRSVEVAGTLFPMIKPNDVILVKGSQSIRMERVVKALLKEPQKADRLLVRQEKEWVSKQ